MTENANYTLMCSLSSFFSISAGNVTTQLDTTFPILPAVRHAHIISSGQWEEVQCAAHGL